MFASELIAKLVQLDTIDLKKDVVIRAQAEGVDMIIEDITVGDDGEAVITVE